MEFSVLPAGSRSAKWPAVALCAKAPFGLQLCFEKVGGFVKLQAEIVVEFGNRV
jgi:hypothetical protein